MLPVRGCRRGDGTHGGSGTVPQPVCGMPPLRRMTCRCKGWRRGGVRTDFFVGNLRRFAVRATPQFIQGTAGLSGDETAESSAVCKSDFPGDFIAAHVRSEERRVGKEC